MNRRFFSLALAAVWVVQGAAAQARAPRVVDLTAPDGTTLKATNFAASKPGPGVMLEITDRYSRTDQELEYRRSYAARVGLTVQ